MKKRKSLRRKARKKKARRKVKLTLLNLNPQKKTKILATCLESK